jgi:hypothetical protein
MGHFSSPWEFAMKTDQAREEWNKGKLIEHEESPTAVRLFLGAAM